MQPPSARRSQRWIDQHWDEIGKILPSVTMDWLYQEHGADRLKHHQWMLTRPSFRAVAQELHEAFAANGDIIMDNVTMRSRKEFVRLDFPDGEQRALAFRFFRRLQAPDGAETAMFLVATVCELIGTTPLCAYQETKLKQWVAAAIAEEGVPHYGNVYNLLVNVIAQTVLWTLGCFPYGLLQQKIMSSSSLAFRIVSDDENLLSLKRYTLAINEQLQRISKHPPSGRTYHESETH